MNNLTEDEIKEAWTETIDNGGVYHTTLSPTRNGGLRAKCVFMALKDRYLWNDLVLDWIDEMNERYGDGS